MSTGSLRDLVGEWELTTDLPGGAGIRGRVVFETMGDVLVQRTAPDGQQWQRDFGIAYTRRSGLSPRAAPER
jgi:hypothetical protein